jgi:hypothetical protein
MFLEAYPTWMTDCFRDMPHSACLEELDDVEAFLRERLPALGDNEAKSEL